MARPIEAINPDLRLAQLLGDEGLSSSMVAAVPSANPADQTASVNKINLSDNPFEAILNKTIEALDGVSQSENVANQLVTRYIKGEADLQEVMVAQAKMSVQVQLAVTTVNTAVNTFKEITQMQV